MADKPKPTTLTNNAEGARGIALANGSVAILEAGETRDVVITPEELDDLPEHFSVSKAKAEPEEKPAESAKK